MDQVRTAGEPALAQYARELDGNAGRLWYGPDDFAAALAALDSRLRGSLERAAARIGRFAAAQRAALTDTELAVPGGRAGHQVLAVDRAGCYVPGGRHPLPSTVLMTALVAKSAGVREVVAACPQPVPVILAACALARVDRLLAAGGAQAIAAMVYGCGPQAAVDVVVGPGNRWVVAAKKLVQSVVRTDAPAGPSELLIIADQSADPTIVAWDLLAQAEHDPDAVPALATTDEAVAQAVEAALEQGLSELPQPSAEIARAALANGWAFVSADRWLLAEAANRFAPEHLELAVVDPDGLVPLCRHAGALFIGLGSAEVFGDYGAGPNHTLPTAGRARSSGGLSVFDFLRIRTWLALDGAGAGLDTAEAGLDGAVDGFDALNVAAGGPGNLVGMNGLNVAAGGPGNLVGMNGLNVAADRLGGLTSLTSLNSLTSLTSLNSLVADTAILARAEGLEAHARAALCRLKPGIVDPGR
jgi:phosphoribosyl-ATP pyrophosphohydrolase/phosphoribosyl-AMP cyclohydrolase/histidinol dehydrogenase